MTRKVTALASIAIVLLSTFPLTGCNAQSVLTDVEKFAPVVTNLLTIACEFTASPLCGTGAALLNVSEQHLFNVWQGYISQEQQGTASESGWADLNAAMQDLINRSSDVFALAHVVNPQHQKEVLDVAAAVEALLAVIEAQMPPAPVKVTLAMGAMRRPARLATFLPTPNPKTKQYDRAWLKQWQKQYNALPAVKARKMEVKTGMLAGLGNAIGESLFGGNR